MNIEIHKGNENRLVQLTPVAPPFLPPCCLCAQPGPTEPDCAHDGKTQEVKPGIIHLRYSSSSVTGLARARPRLARRRYKDPYRSHAAGVGVDGCAEGTPTAPERPFRHRAPISSARG